MNKHCCVILARGCSKRIPGKNSLPFNGLPMVAWPTRAAVQARLFGQVVISTDSAAIEAVACAHGATSMGLRAPALATDHITTAQVVSAFLADLAQRQAVPEFLCCLYGTSVFVTADLLREGLERLQGGGADMVLAVSPYPHPPERAFTMDGAGRLVYAAPDRVEARTQDFPPAFYDLGLFYWLRTAALLHCDAPSFVPLVKEPVRVPRSRAIDIDWPEDLVMAEILHRHLHDRADAHGLER